MFTGIFKVCTAPSFRSDYVEEITLGSPTATDDVFSEVGPWLGTARIRVYGKLSATRKGEIWAADSNGNLVQFGSADNWIRPVSLTEQEDWQVRFTNMTGDTAQLAGNANDVWVSLNSNTYADISLSDPTGPSIQYTVTGDLEIRAGGVGPAEYTSGFFVATETDEKKQHGK